MNAPRKRGAQYWEGAKVLKYFIIFVCALFIIPIFHYYAKPEPLKCEILLKGLPGTFCERRDMTGNIYYINDDYEVKIRKRGRK